MQSQIACELDLNCGTSGPADSVYIDDPRLDRACGVTPGGLGAYFGSVSIGLLMRKPNGNFSHHSTHSSKLHTSETGSLFPLPSESKRGSATITASSVETKP